MTKNELLVLGQTFGAEIEDALNVGIGLLQTKSKSAKKLVADGYLLEVREVLGGQFPVTVDGYRLTQLGMLTYCASIKKTCTDERPCIRCFADSGECLGPYSSKTGERNA